MYCIWGKKVIYCTALEYVNLLASERKYIHISQTRDSLAYQLLLWTWNILWFNLACCCLWRLTCNMQSWVRLAGPFLLTSWEPFPLSSNYLYENTNHDWLEYHVIQILLTTYQFSFRLWISTEMCLGIISNMSMKIVGSASWRDVVLGEREEVVVVAGEKGEEEEEHKDRRGGGWWWW